MRCRRLEIGPTKLPRVATGTGQAGARTIGSNVAQRSAFPCIGDSEYEAAIASHENILFLFTRRGWCAVRFWFDLARGARMTWCTLRRRRVIGDFLIIGCGRLRVGRL